MLHIWLGILPENGLEYGFIDWRLLINTIEVGILTPMPLNICFSLKSLLSSSIC